MTGVIFDLDGVLVDSEPYWQQGFVNIVTQFCSKHHLPDLNLTIEKVARFQGGRVNDTIQTIIFDAGYGDKLDATALAELTQHVIDDVCGRFAANATPIESSVEVAHQLAERGIPLAVASSSAQQFIDVALLAIGLDDAFSVTQSALELQDGKPHPEVYLLTLKKMGLAAHEAIAIEDSTTGLTSALRARLATIWLLQDTEEAKGEALDRLRSSMGEGYDPSDLVRTVTRKLTIKDVEDVLETL